VGGERRALYSSTETAIVQLLSNLFEGLISPKVVLCVLQGGIVLHNHIHAISMNFVFQKSAQEGWVTCYAAQLRKLN